MNDDYINEIVAVSADGTEMNRDEYIMFLKNIIDRLVDESEKEVERTKRASDKNLMRLIEGNIDVVEQMNMALSFKSDNKEVQNFKQGVSMAYSTLTDHLEIAGIKRMNSLHKEFNANYHDALLTEPVEDNRKGRVIKVIKEGYMMNDKMLFPAVVVVGE